MTEKTDLAASLDSSDVQAETSSTMPMVQSGPSCHLLPVRYVGEVVGLSTKKRVLHRQYKGEMTIWILGVRIYRSFGLFRKSWKENSIY